MASPPPRAPATDRERVAGHFHDPERYERTRFLAPAARAHAAWAARCFDAMLPAAGDAARVVDVGAGTGRFTRLVLDRGFRVTATDLSAEMAACLARDLAGSADGRARVMRADAFALPFGDGAFDAGVCMSLIGRFAGSDDQAAALRELSRVVRPGGWLVFNMRNPRSAFSRWRGKGGLTDRGLREIGRAVGFAIEARRRVHVVSGAVVRYWPSAIARIVVRLDRVAVAIPGLPAHNVLYRARRIAPPTR